MKKEQTTWWHFAVAIMICVLISIAASLRAQNYEQADSLGVIFQDSTVVVYFEWKQDDGSIKAEYTNKLDTATAANFIFNTAVGANNQTFQALQLLGRTRKINALTSDASSALELLTGQTYRQTAEVRFIPNLAITCDSTGQCQTYYTFKQDGQPNKILRIRRASNGNVTLREVNDQGNNVSGGLQASLRFQAGANLMELVFTAGSLNGTTITVYNFGLTKNNRPIWTALDTSFMRQFSLIQRNRLADTGANALGN